MCKTGQILWARFDKTVAEINWICMFSLSVCVCVCVCVIYKWDKLRGYNQVGLTIDQC